MKKTLSFILALVLLAISMVGCTSNGNSTGNTDNDSNTKGKEADFHSLVAETQSLLDIVADDIYSYWYDCIYKDKYLESIDYAIACAVADNQENMDKIKANNDTIKTLYSEVRDGKLQVEAKAVMQAYNDYYAFVMEVSGSFNSFSADKETLKKALSSALKDLEFEL